MGTPWEQAAMILTRAPAGLPQFPVRPGLDGPVQVCLVPRRPEIDVAHAADAADAAALGLIRTASPIHSRLSAGHRRHSTSGRAAPRL
jgi:hypothetical protein